MSNPKNRNAYEETRKIKNVYHRKKTYGSLFAAALPYEKK
jgi:hypothetical protein